MEEKTKLTIMQISEQIEKQFNEGFEDEEIAKNLNITSLQVANIRSVMGLKRHWAINVFEESKTLTKNAINNLFECKFSIPKDLHEKLGINLDDDYHFICTIIGKKEIKVTIMRK